MMRSDTNVETRTRSDGRQSLSRRRLTRVTNSGENGAFENDLALAMQESLRYAKQEEANKKRQQEESLIERNGLDVQNKVGEVTMSGRACMESPKGPKQLKELLLLHVDLVQHQQELLSQKDKEIKQLQEERAALTCRLERMERRMSLLKQKDDLSDMQNKSFGSPSSCVQSASKATQEQSSTVDRGTKRKSAGLEPQNLTKRFAAEAQKTLASSTPSHRTERHQRYRNRSATVSSTVSSTPSIEPVTSNIASPRKNQRSAKNIRDSPDNSVLRTSDPYYVSYYEPPNSEDIDLESRGDIVQGAHKELQVELPQWQNRTYTNLWVLEGTENLEDEVFLKRHQKPEIEEKRRKRWDLQRIREQKIYEKLKEKERGEVCNKDEGQQSNTLESFYPSLDTITHIEVTNKIPVMVFGHPVPSLDKTEFSLPWELETCVRAHPSRSSRNSRHT